MALEGTQNAKSENQDVEEKDLGLKRLKSRFVVQTGMVLLIFMLFRTLKMVATLNLKMVLIYVVIAILQKLFAKRNQTLVNWTIKYLNPFYFFNKSERIIEGQVPEEGVMFTQHPHAIWSLGVMLNLNKGNDPYSRMTQLGSRFILTFPFIGAFLRIIGVQSVHAANMEALMKKKRNIGIVPGGYEEATITSNTKFRLYLKNRKGFIKMALRTGYKICPVLIFNEHKMFKSTDFALKFRLILNKFKIPGTLFWGRFGIFPDHNLDVYTVIGTPIELPLTPNPTVQQIKAWHKIYVEEVTRLYQKYKHLNGNSPLEIY